jgi:dihydroorotate dehydrogenase electron transfer subunit
MIDKVVSIVENRQISPDFFLLKFEWKLNWGEPEPGQFLELRVESKATTPLLRRPFAFSGYDSEREVAEMIYQKRGITSENLSKQIVGDKLNILGPLGTKFGISEPNHNLLAVAGGVGLGPILFAARRRAERGLPVKLIAGFRDDSFVPDEFLWAGISTKVCTDDGSEGFKGNVVEYLNSLNLEDIENSTIWSCGPTPMLSALHKFSNDKRIECEVSMEEMMACGLGACMGCVIETVDGLKRVCKEGPIFKSGEVIWS